MDLILIKFGGSLLTDKTRPGHAREDVIERLAEELAAARANLPPGTACVLGHGSGSFGHVEARRAGLSSLAPAGASQGAALREGIAATQAAAADLHHRLVGALVRHGACPFSLPPSSFLTTAAGQVASLQAEPLLRAIEGGLLPVVYGDVVLDTSWGACIRSTEHVFEALLDPLLGAGHRLSRVLWLGETAGLLDAVGRTVASLSAPQLQAWIDTVAAPRGTDVTGGMSLRLSTVQRFAEHGVVSVLLDGRRAALLQEVLGGQSPGPSEGTVITP